MGLKRISFVASVVAITAIGHAGTTVVVLPDVILGNTCGEDDTCEFLFPDAPDAHFEFDVVRSVSRTFHMCGSGDWDSVLVIGNETCGQEVGLGDNLCVLYGGGGHGILRPENLAPGTYAITIDGFNTQQCGDYTLSAYCSADVDRDGLIRFADLLDLLGAWGTSCQLCPEDINLDGEVTFADLLVVLSDFGPCE